MKISFYVTQLLRRKLSLGLAAFGLFLWSAAPISAAPGDLDLTFGNGGKVVTPIGSDNDYSFGAAIQSDGKIVLAGESFNGTNRDFALARYNTDGSLDTSFGSGGKAVTPIGSSDESAGDLVIQSDGKIIVAGYSYNANSLIDFALVRYNTDGSLDTSFGIGGKVVTPFGSVGSDLVIAHAIAIQSDGKIVAAGRSFGEFNKFALARYNTNGSLDTSFGTGGKLTTQISGNSNDEAYAVAILSDGKIVAVGRSFNGANYDFAIVKYNTNGSLDTNFGTGGKVTTNINNNDNALAVSIQSDNKIVVGGHSIGSNEEGDFTITRYKTDGSLDTSFGSGGKQTTDISNNDLAYALTIQSDGRILLAGIVNGNFAMARYNTDGSLDASFGSGGKVLTTVSNGSIINGLVIQSDGKIVAAGYSNNGTNVDFALARYYGDQQTRSALFDFDGDGKADVSVFRPENGAWYLQQSQNGFTGVSFGLSTDKIVPADYDGDGKTDVAVYRGGTWYLQRSTLGFTGVGFGEANDIPVPADYDGDRRADIAVFRPSNGTWYLLQSTAGFTGIAFGQTGDKPVAADYDGDGKTDVAVNRSGTWYIQRSQLGFTGIAFGLEEDKLVPADYDGDGKADVAVFRPSNGTWYLQQSTAGFTGIAFGQTGDKPVPADYDGDGKTDVAVFRDGIWYLRRSQAGFTGVAFGTASDKPVPNAFVP